jgi:hypothetical protein
MGVIPIAKFDDAFKSGLEAHPSGPLLKVLETAFDELKTSHEPNFYGANKNRPKVHNLGAVVGGQISITIDQSISVTIAMSISKVTAHCEHTVYGKGEYDLTVNQDTFLDELDRTVDEFRKRCERRMATVMLYTPDCITHEGKVFTDATIMGRDFKTIGLHLGDPEGTVEALKENVPEAWRRDAGFLKKLAIAVGDAMALLPTELPIDTNDLSVKGGLEFIESFVVFKSKRSKYWNRPNKISSKNMPALRPMLVGVFSGKKNKDVYIGRVGEGDGKYFLMMPVKNSSGWKSYSPVQEDGKAVVLKDDTFVDNLMQKAIDKAKDPIKDAQDRKRGR